MTCTPTLKTTRLFIMKKTIAALIAGLFATAAFAQTPAVTTPPPAVAKVEAKQEKQEAKANVKATKAAAKADVKLAKQNAKAEVKEAKAEAKDTKHEANAEVKQSKAEHSAN
jgi:hypothetical protein